MAYADFSYYKDIFMGDAIAEEAFPRYAMQASRFLDYITLQKAQGAGDIPALKDACCALAEQYQLMDSIRRAQAKGLAASAENAGKELKSEAVGPWSKSYTSGGESAVGVTSLYEDLNKSLGDIAQQYLAHTGLLYRGGRCGRCSPTR